MTSFWAPPASLWAQFSDLQAHWGQHNHHFSAGYLLNLSPDPDSHVVLLWHVVSFLLLWLEENFKFFLQSFLAIAVTCVLMSWTISMTSKKYNPPRVLMCSNLSLNSLRAKNKLSHCSSVCFLLLQISQVKYIYREMRSNYWEMKTPFKKHTRRHTSLKTIILGENEF